MLTFDAPSLPSQLAIRECSRPRFDANLDKLSDWLAGLRSAGIRQSGPALIMALENLRRTEISTKRRLSVLSVLKVPLLKTCAGLPKPGFADEKSLSTPFGVTLEQRLYRLMFVNLSLALRQLDQQDGRLSSRDWRKREWAIRNIFRFANRQIRYAALWKISLPAKTWLDLHALHVYLMTQPLTPDRSARPRESSTIWTDPELEYKQLLLFGLAAQLNDSVVRTDTFLGGLAGWAAQTLLEDPQRMLGRIKLFVVAIFEDSPARQLAEPLGATFRGWVLQAPYSYIHQIEETGSKIEPRSS